MDEIPASSTTRWLPTPRAPLTITKAVNMGNIKSRQNSDWFMGLATGMHTVTKDQTQCRMFAKMAFFMMDFFPRGLVSDFGHIKGDDVMHQLLCHVNEMAASRHKVSRDAETAWLQLERWMSLGEDWKAASKNAQRNPSAGKNRHKPTGKVPGLLSPAGLLAVLILAYPDVKKYQTRIEQLGIQWMIQRRDRLRVQRGFWKEITNSDLYSIFDAEEERRSELTFLADYNQLFGKDFPLCRVDMQPYLPPWALGCVEVTTTRTEAPLDDLDDYTPYIINKPDGVGLHEKTAMFTKPSSSLEADAGTHEDTDTEADGDADAELSINKQASISYGPDVSETAHDIQRLSMVLNPVRSKAETDLMKWLMARPCAEEVLLPWCRFWADMHDQALSYDEQIVIRSLFLQSLRRLESIQASDFSDAAESYMLQDMEDVRATPFTPGSGALEELKRSQGYVAWEAMCAQLMQHVDRGCAGDLTMLLDQQICFFRKIQAHKIFSSYTEDVITLDRLRARGFLYVKHSEGEEERSYRRRLLDNRAALRLTNWQLRAIVMPGHNDVLTPEQASIYEGKVASSSRNSFTYTVPPQPTIPLDIPVDRDQIDVRLGYELLRKLFGKIPPPGCIPVTTSTSDATESAPPAKAGQSREMQFESTPIRRLQDMVNESAKETCLFPMHASFQPKSNPIRTLHNLADTAPGSSSRQSSATPSVGLSTDKSLFAMYESMNQGKRTASPTTRPPKRVKLAELTREDLAEDLETYSGCLKVDLVREIRSSRSELTSEVAERVAQTEALLSAKMTRLVEASLDRLRSELIKKLDSQETQARQTSDVMIAVSNQIEANLGKLQARLANLEASLAKPSPQIGEDGFLTQNCPAPKGWNQKDYEALLTRAAINLIANQESPTEELLITIDKYTSVKDSFPDISVQHFSIVFEHEYIRAFNRPLDRTKLLGLDD